MMSERKKMMMWIAIFLVILLSVYGLISAVIDLVSWIGSKIWLREAVKTDLILPEAGVRRASLEEADTDRFLFGISAKDESAQYLLNTYVEDESPVPEWWNPDEPMQVEWYDEDHFREDTQMVERYDIGCPDYNLEYSISGWNGHTMESWEMDLFGRIVYLEFNGTEPECMNAGIDSILNLWESEYFGRTIFETLSATAENGALVYTTYGYVWEWDYDPDDLAWCLSLCEERFYNGPRWNCCFFQLYGYPEWAEPLYCLDGVYFSTFKE